MIFFTFAKFWNFSKTAVLCRLVQTWIIWLDKSRTNKLDLVLVVMSCMLCHLTYVILLNQFDAIKHISDFEPIFARFRIFLGGSKQKSIGSRFSGCSVFWLFGVHNNPNSRTASSCLFGVRSTMFPNLIFRLNLDY